MHANWTQFTVATPFIGTPMHAWAAGEGLIAPDFYKILNAHSTSPGNETLRPADIERLHRFAKFLQDNLINRRGILKNAVRRDPAYRAARSLADAVARVTALTFFAVGRAYFRQSVKPLPPRPRADRASPCRRRRSRHDGRPPLTAER